MKTTDNKQWISKGEKIAYGIIFTIAAAYFTFHVIAAILRVNFDINILPLN